MGIAWYVDKEKIGRPCKNQKKQKPILILYPGLGGGHNNLYTHSLAKKAMKDGYKCGVAMFRCAEGTPITSYRVTCSVSADDGQELIDYVHSNYIVDSQTQEKKTRLYCYGASLGALILGR
jgi:predicted alpha/beta-fold hydrolase